MDLFQRKPEMRSKTLTLHERAKHSNQVKILQDYIFLIKWEVKTALYYAIINNQKQGLWFITAHWGKQCLLYAWNATKLVVSKWFFKCPNSLKKWEMKKKLHRIKTNQRDKYCTLTDKILRRRKNSTSSQNILFLNVLSFGFCPVNYFCRFASAKQFHKPISNSVTCSALSHVRVAFLQIWLWQF